MDRRFLQRHGLFFGVWEQWNELLPMFHDTNINTALSSADSTHEHSTAIVVTSVAKPPTRKS